MTTLVTGGSGFIGTNLIARLRSDGVPVANLDAVTPADPGQRELWHRADLTEREAVREVIRAVRPDRVVHLAARTDLESDEVGAYAANTSGTGILLEELSSMPEPPALIAASSRLVCRIGYQPRHDEDFCPPNAYGESKVLTEQIVRGFDYPSPWAIVRPTSIWGPWFGVPYKDFFTAVAAGRYRHPAGHRILKSFGYVENTAHQLVQLLNAIADNAGRLFYLADYDPVEVSDWADRIAAATHGPPVRDIPVWVLRVIARAGDVYEGVGGNHAPLTRFRLANLMTEMLYDLEPIRAVAPELPVNLDTGVGRTTEWLRAIEAK